MCEVWTFLHSIILPLLSVVHSSDLHPLSALHTSDLPVLSILHFKGLGPLYACTQTEGMSWQLLRSHWCRGAWVHARSWWRRQSYKSSLHMLLNFIHNGNFNDDLGSIMYTIQIARSQDCALVLCKLEIALIITRCASSRLACSFQIPRMCSADCVQHKCTQPYSKHYICLVGYCTNISISFRSTTPKQWYVTFRSVLRSIWFCDNLAQFI